MKKKLRNYWIMKGNFREKNSTFERDIILLEKEILGLKQHEIKLNNDLMWLGYKELNDADYDVDDLVIHLTEEYELLKSRINLRV